jgi:F-type H+-transporting ATPase subunit a
MVLTSNVYLKIYGFFPIIFFIFIFILSSNVLGIIPLFFTATSLASLTFFLSLTFFIGINLIGVELHKFDFICIFVPSGVPGVLLILLISIEIISYLVRPISLAMRLCANMLAGHVLIKIISGYLVKVLESCFVF